MSLSIANDLELLMELSDWDSDNEVETRRTYKCRINFMSELNNYEFIYRFRLCKTAVSNLLTEIYPNLKVTSKR